MCQTAGAHQSPFWPNTDRLQISARVRLPAILRAFCVVRMQWRLHRPWRAVLLRLQCRSRQPSATYVSILGLAEPA